MKYYKFVLGLVLAVLSYASMAKETGFLLEQAENLSWEVYNEKALKALIASKEDARTLLADTAGYNDAVSEVSDFRFMDLNGDGTLELIVAFDVSGRAFFNNVSILWKRNKKINVEDVRAFNITDLNLIIKDLDGDGQMELVVPTATEPYRGVEPMAVITMIYEIQGAGYTEASRRFKQYYEDKVIPNLRERLEIAKQQKHTGLVGKLQKELSETERLLNE